MLAVSSKKVRTGSCLPLLHHLSTLNKCLRTEDTQKLCRWNYFPTLAWCATSVTQQDLPCILRFGVRHTCSMWDRFSTGTPILQYNLHTVATRGDCGLASSRRDDSEKHGKSGGGITDAGTLCCQRSTQICPSLAWRTQRPWFPKSIWNVDSSNYRTLFFFAPIHWEWSLVRRSWQRFWWCMALRCMAFTDNGFLKCSWTHVLISVTEKYQLLIQCRCLSSQRSRTFNVGFWLYCLLPDFLNVMILWTVGDEVFKCFATIH